MLRYRVLLLLAAMIGVVACSDRVTDVETVFDRLEPQPGTDGQTSTFGFVQQKILTPSCSMGGCHSGAVSPDLSEGEAYASTVGRLSSTGMLLVDPGSPENSYLYVKMRGGDQMVGSLMPPPGQPAVEAGLIDSLAVWIERGALPDEK